MNSRFLISKPITWTMNTEQRRKTNLLFLMVFLVCTFENSQVLYDSHTFYLFPDFLLSVRAQTLRWQSSQITFLLLCRNSNFKKTTSLCSNTTNIYVQHIKSPNHDAATSMPSSRTNEVEWMSYKRRMQSLKHFTTIIYHCTEGVYIISNILACLFKASRSYTHKTERNQ